jgi:hypothetical protein
MNWGLIFGLLTILMSSGALVYTMRHYKRSSRHAVIGGFGTLQLGFVLVFEGIVPPGIVKQLAQGLLLLGATLCLVLEFKYWRHDRRELRGDIGPSEP